MIIIPVLRGIHGIQSSEHSWQIPYTMLELKNSGCEVFFLLLRGRSHILQTGNGDIRVSN